MLLPGEGDGEYPGGEVEGDSSPVVKRWTLYEQRCNSDKRMALMKTIGSLSHAQEIEPKTIFRNRG